MAEKLKLDPLNKPLMGEELKRAADEIWQDEQAAKLRDSGAVDCQAWPATADEILELDERIEKLQRVYEVAGRDGLKEFGEADVWLLLSAKQLELGQVSEKLGSRDGTELDVMLKGRLEAEVSDLSLDSFDRIAVNLFADQAKDHAAGPTQEQVDDAVRQIADVVGRNYVYVGGDMCGCAFAPEGGGAVGRTYCYPPEAGEAVPFAEIPDKEKIELLTAYVGWDGFSFDQDRLVMQNILNGKDQSQWMLGIQGAPTRQDSKAAFAELMRESPVLEGHHQEKELENNGKLLMQENGWTDRERQRREKANQDGNAENDQNEQAKGRSLPAEQQEKKREEDRGRGR